MFMDVTQVRLPGRVAAISSAVSGRVAMMNDPTEMIRRRKYISGFFA